MAQDKEKIKELNKRIKDLESIIDSKNGQLHDYQDIEKIADEKIKGLNAIHAEKIRALMNSIQLLKKEKASMGKQTKEHKRSEFIQQLNKEIGDQDVIIETLRSLIGDPKKADAAIISTLSKGPARIRVQTREELKMEIKDLKSKLLKYEKKKGQGATVEEEKMDVSQEQQSVMSAKVIETKTNSGNAEYIMKINDLNNEVEDLHLVVSGKQTEIDKYKQLISKKNQEIIELTQAKIDLKFMVTKNEELKKEVDALQQKLNSDLYANYDQEIKLGELELAQAVHKNIQNKNSEAVKLEIETLQTKLSEMLNQNKQMVVTHSKLKDENVNLRKLLEDAKERNRKLSSEHEEQVNKLHANVKEKDANIKTINAKLTDYEDQFDQLQIEIKNKEDLVGELEAKVAELEERIANRSERSASRKGSDSLEIDHKELEAQKYELEKEINYLKQENYRMRERIKELTKSEIELSDRVDILEQENRFLCKKVIAANLITKENFNDHIAPEEVQKNLKEISQRYEVRIKELTRRITELETRNKDLEEIQKIINNPSSVRSLSGQIDSMALTEGDHNESLADKI